MHTARFLRMSAGLLCASLAGPACSSKVARGHALYSDGYYVEAAEVFERNERRLSEWPPTERATYGLYRGLTLMQLGDLKGAARWFAYARWVASEHPSVLPPQEAALLAQSEQVLNQRLGRSPADLLPPTMATAERHPAAPRPADQDSTKVRRSFAQ